MSPIRVDRVDQEESDLRDSRCSAACPATISESAVWTWQPSSALATCPDHAEFPMQGLCSGARGLNCSGPRICPGRVRGDGGERRQASGRSWWAGSGTWAGASCLGPPPPAPAANTLASHAPSVSGSERRGRRGAPAQNLCSGQKPSTRACLFSVSAYSRHSQNVVELYILETSGF